MTNSTETTTPVESAEPKSGSTTSTSTEKAISQATTPVSSEKSTIAAPYTEGNWNDQKTKLKARFSILTDTDMHYENGKKNEMYTRIQEKIGKTKEELSTIIAGL